MKEKILDYIKRNPGADLHMISGEINEDEKIVLKAINDLLKMVLLTFVRRLRLIRTIQAVADIKC